MITSMKKQIAQRLKKARISAGYERAKDFCEAHGITYPTYIHHEGGNQGIKQETLEKYAELLNVDFMWLLKGTGSPATSATNTPVQGQEPPQANSVMDEISRFLASYQSLSKTARIHIDNLLRESLLENADKSGRNSLAHPPRTNKQRIKR